jgi:hypothetical protein
VPQHRISIIAPRRRDSNRERFRQVAAKYRALGLKKLSEVGAKTGVDYRQVN